MLHRVHIVRLAFQHSPEKEQRLLAYQQGKNIIDQFSGSENVDASDKQKGVPASILRIQRQTREKLAFLNDLSRSDSDDENERNAILSTFFSEHQSFLNTYFQSELNHPLTQELQNPAIIEQLRHNFRNELNEIARQSPEKQGPKYNFYGTENAFARRYMREELKLSSEETIDDEALEAFKARSNIPNAFSRGKTIHFNMDHEDFNYEKMLNKLHDSRPNITEEQVLEIVERNRERAAVHEIAHYCLNQEAETGKSLAEELKEQIKQTLRVKSLEKSKEWIQLMESVDTAFQGKFRGKADIDYLHEAIAITMAGSRKPYQKDAPERAVMTALQTLRSLTNNNQKIRELMEKFDATLRHQLDGDDKHEASLDFARRKMDVATSERTKNLIFQSKCDEHGISRSNNPNNEVHEADKASAAAHLASAESADATPAKILEKINTVQDRLQSLNETKDSILANFPPESREAEQIALEKLLDKFNADMDDLKAIENSVMTLHHWNNNAIVSRDEKNTFAERFKFIDLGRYDASMTASSVIHLDSQNKNARQEVIREIDSIVTSYFTPIDAIHAGIKKVDDDKLDEAQKKERMDRFEDPSMFNWIHKRFFDGKTSNVAWLSVFDMIKIYNIYKDAILDRYHSKQKVRTGDAAKNWNFWKPLQPDLDKQARSANEEEVHSFKEFLEKEKFTYDQLLLGEDCVLKRNKKNVNRAKAVLEYAADHAWLYHMDRGNGNNVYGVDYEGIFGIRAFEELVEHNNAQQEKEKGNGRAKVNNDPDIPLLVVEIEHELHKKNIWVVLGIVERLQEKAKFSESNTWALVTIIKALRDDPDGSLREVFAVGGKGMMDAIGGIGIGSSAWSLTLFKSQRNALMDWINLGCTDEAAKEVGEKHMKAGNLEPHSFIPEVISRIEQELYADTAGLKKSGKEGVNHKIGRVLAAQTVGGKGGKQVSIFDDNEVFNGYRDYWKATPTTTDPGKTDDDFFTPSNGGSDIRLLWGDGVKAILECTSLGQFSHSTKAIGYLTQVIMLEHELKTKNPAAHSNYVQEIKEKLTAWYFVGANNDNTSKTFGTYQTSTLKKPPELSEKNILFELWKRGMIDRKFYVHFVQGLKADTPVPAELTPLRTALDKVKKLQSEKATPSEITTAQEEIERVLQESGPR